MNIVQCIRDRIQARACKGASGGQDLVLYRQLRRTESKLFEARESLGRMMALQKQALAEHARIKQACDDPRQQNMGLQPDELQKKIACMSSDINRLEAEYKQVQMNVRTYFYLETYPGHLPEGGVTAGQPAQ
jgi:uncharacterized small protein (DUF1192 family)